MDDRGTTRRQRGGPLVWLGGIAAVVAVGVLITIASLLIRSAREAHEVARAGEHLPQLGTYDLTTQPGEGRTTTVDDGAVRVEATSVVVSAKTVSVALTWSTTTGRDVQLSCASDSAPGGSWWATSDALAASASEQSSASCPATGALDVAADRPVTDRHVFARDAAWGDGPATLAVWTVASATTDPDRTTPPTAQLTVDLSQARFTAS